MNDFSLEELLPIVAKLTEKYTSKESTSITYEKAQQLMEAVLYCIRECQSENLPSDSKKLSAEAAYKRGYEIVIEKVNCAREKYNQMILHFYAYGNENYHDTVTKGIPGFFKFYDATFAPQETILTMDYPTLQSTYGITGIDAIEKYISYISLEQIFMGALPEQYVKETLYQFHAGYRKQFYNICQIVIRNILGHMLVGKHLNLPLTKEDYKMIKTTINLHGKDSMAKKVSWLLEQLISEKYNSNEELFYYLSKDIEDYCTDLSLLRGSIFID